MGIGADPALARASGGPAELPPASFQGRQFVDSRGCVFVRAGYNGVVNWVPRLSQDRKQECGYPPSFGTGATVAAAAPAPAPARPPVETAAVRMTPAPTAPVPNQAQIDAALAANCPGLGDRAGRVTLNIGGVLAKCPATAAPVAATPPAEVAAAAAPAMAPAARQPSQAQIDAALAETCPGLGARADRVTLNIGGVLAKCPPQAAPAPVYVAAAPAPMLRAAPAEMPIAEAVPLAVPKGYKTAWADGRLNPNRGPRTAEGDAQMAQIYQVNRVPMVARTAAAGKGYRPRVVVSTKSPHPATAGAGQGWVQVGTFGVAANAASAMAQLRASGLPVASTRITRGGASQQIVLAGPFGSAAETQRGLAAARRAGFADAFARD